MPDAALSAGAAAAIAAAVVAATAASAAESGAPAYAHLAVSASDLEQHAALAPPTTRLAPVPPSVLRLYSVRLHASSQLQGEGTLEIHARGAPADVETGPSASQEVQARLWRGAILTAAFP